MFAGIYSMQSIAWEMRRLTKPLSHSQCDTINSHTLTAPGGKLGSTIVQPKVEAAEAQSVRDIAEEE